MVYIRFRLELLEKHCRSTRIDIALGDELHRTRHSHILTGKNIIFVVNICHRCLVTILLVLDLEFHTKF